MIQVLLEFKTARAVVTVADGAITVGRDSDNTIRLDDERVSRHHCSIEPGGSSGWHVIDLDSQNGTFVNGARISGGVVVSVTDNVTIGNVQLRILSSSPPIGEPSRVPKDLPQLGDGSFTDAHQPDADPHEPTRQFLKDRLLRLNLATQAVASDRDLDRFLSAILDVILDFTGFERALFLFVEEGELRPAIGRNFDRASLNAEAQAFSRRVINLTLKRRDATLIRESDDGVEWSGHASWENLGLKCAMSLPLEAPLRAPPRLTADDRRRATPEGPRLLGVIYLDSKWDVRAFSAQDRHLLRSVSAQAAIAIQNSRLHQLACTDQLTQLMHRGTFEQCLQDEMSYAGEERRTLGLLLLDIDRFKLVNDTHGHQVGDEVLRGLARRLREVLRAEDVVGRFGGEEFSILLPNTTLEGARVTATKVAAAVRAVSYGTAQLPVTVSIGVAVFPNHGVEQTLLMKRADQALYAAKNAGRDRVEVWNPSLDQPGHRTDGLAGIFSGDVARDQQNLKALITMISATRSISAGDSFSPVLAGLRDVARCTRAALFVGDHPARLKLVRVEPEVSAEDGRRLTGIVSNILADASGKRAVRIEEGGRPRWFLCAPLIDGASMFGAIAVDGRTGKDEFTPHDYLAFETIVTLLGRTLVLEPKGSPLGPRG